MLKTVLGRHLLARTETGWEHLDPDTLNVHPDPSAEDRHRLLVDALEGKDAARYGTLESGQTTTDAGVRLSLNWKRLAISQTGPDTDRINALYKVHYLQWTGVEALDRALGFIGLVGVFILAAIGLKLSLRRG